MHLQPAHDSCKQALFASWSRKIMNFLEFHTVGIVTVYLHRPSHADGIITKSIFTLSKAHQLETKT